MQVKNGRVPEGLSASCFSESDLKLARQGQKYQYYREMADQFHLDPGMYIIIPSTYDRSHEANYLLRVYTQSLADGR